MNYQKATVRKEPSFDIEEYSSSELQTSELLSELVTPRLMGDFKDKALFLNRDLGEWKIVEDTQGHLNLICIKGK